MNNAARLSLLVVAGSSLMAFAQFPMWGDFQRHSSTVEEGVQRGMADVIRSAGAANLMNSAAANNYEDARKKYIENRLQATETYFEMKRVNREYRDANRPAPPTQDQLIRLSRSRLPDRLGPASLDPLTGRIRWPMALLAEPFAPHRQMLEAIFQERAVNGYITPDQYLAVRQETDAMMDQLRAIISQLTPNQSVAGRRFLESLAYEAGLSG